MEHESAKNKQLRKELTVRAVMNEKIGKLAVDKGKIMKK